MTTGLVRLFGFAALVAVSTLGVPVAASASLLSLGASTSGSYLFQTNSGGLVSVATNGGVSISGLATFQADSGAYTLGTTVPSFNVGPQNGNQFPATGNRTQTFSYTGLSDTDALTGTITWSFIQDGTTTPEFFGSLLVNTVSAASDAAFKATFMVGQTYGIDLITQALGTNSTCPAPCTLEFVANPSTGASRTTAPVGSGAVTPLPGALPLLATGLGGLGLLGWRRKRKAQAVA
jgi:hypothetical protein